jgi:hypothetical protein
MVGCREEFFPAPQPEAMLSGLEKAFCFFGEKNGGYREGFLPMTTTRSFKSLFPAPEPET